MSQRIRYFWALLSTFILLALLVSCGGINTAGMQLDTGEQVLNKVCNHCHSHERICATLGDPKDKWQSRVKRMNMYGANLNAAQAKAIIKFLAAQKPGAAVVCGTGG